MATPTLTVTETGTALVGVVTNGPGNLNDAVELYQLKVTAQSYRQQIIADGATHYWRMEEPSGTVIADVVGGANGTISGGVLLNQPGPIGDGNPSMSFDGTAGAVVNGPVSTPITCTIEGWILPPAAGDYRPLCSSYAMGGFTGDSLAVGLSGAQLTVISSGAPQVFGTTSVSFGVWHHLVFVFTDLIVSLYVDGVFTETLAFDRLAGVGPTTIGWTSAAPCSPMGLDDVAIYERALTAEEISAHYALASMVMRPNANTPLNWAYLNNSQTVPSTPLTSGQVVFSKVRLPFGVYRMVFTRLATPPPHITTTFALRAEPKVVLEMEFLGRHNGWTIVRDWYMNPGLSWHRGLPGNQLLDLVADIGTLHFTLDNSAKNSGHKVGYYSPDHSNKRNGFYLNIGVRVRIGSLIRFTGTLSSIEPVPGKQGPRTVACEVTDWMGVADRVRLDNLDVQENKRGDEVFNILINSLAPSNQPDAVQVDISPDIFPYTLDRVRDEETVLRDEIYRLCTSGLSRVYPLGNGVVVYEARGRRATVSTSVDTFTDSHGFSVLHDRTAVVNRVQTTIHPRIPGQDIVVLYAMPQAMPMEASASITILGPWTDPANKQTRVASTDLEPLVAGTDYTANTLADGSGTDLTPQLTVTTQLSGNATSFTISCATGGFLTKLQQRGKPLYDYGSAVLVWEDTNSVTQFGLSSQQIDMPYSANASLALEVAQFAVYNGAFPLSTLSGFTRLVNIEDSFELQRSIGRQISDRISITDGVTGVSKAFFINAVDETVVENKVQTQWLLAPADTTGYWILEVDGSTELDLTTILAFGQIIGHTDIPHDDQHQDVVHSDIPHTDTHTDNIFVDVAHVDYDTHYDVVDHSDSTTHNDVTHQDVVHSDTPHTDVPGVNWHTDNPHNDGPHEDWHNDSPHQDVAHVDDHNDQHVDSPHTVTHEDHGDKSYNPSHQDFFGDIPHGDTHGDGHADTHSDQGHGDQHTDEAHEDYPYQTGHGDVPHQDVLHGDVTHVDVAHVDSTPHTDSATHSDTVVHSDGPHTDIPHEDIAHEDVTHSDIPFADHHGDFHGDIN